MQFVGMLVRRTLATTYQRLVYNNIMLDLCLTYFCIEKPQKRHTCTGMSVWYIGRRIVQVCLLSLWLKCLFLLCNAYFTNSISLMQQWFVWGTFIILQLLGTTVTW